jgi:hypothetical protein
VEAHILTKSERQHILLLLLLVKKKQSQKLQPQLKTTAPKKTGARVKEMSQEVMGHFLKSDNPIEHAGACWDKK